MSAGFGVAAEAPGNDSSEDDELHNKLEDESNDKSGDNSTACSGNDTALTRDRACRFFPTRLGAVPKAGNDTGVGGETSDPSKAQSQPNVD